MFVDAGAEKRLDEGTAALDTGGGSVPMRKMGRRDINGVTVHLCVVDPLAEQSLCSVSLLEKDRWHHELGAGEAALYHPQERRRILPSRCNGLYVLSMKACAAEAKEEITIMAGDELLCRMPKMAKMATAVRIFCFMFRMEAVWINCYQETLISTPQVARTAPPTT